MGSEYNPNLEAEKENAEAAAAPAKTKGVRSRLSAAANRLRGKKDEEGHSHAPTGGESTRAPAQRRRAAPKKAG